MNGIINQAEELGYDVILYTRYDQSQVEEMANALSDGRTDGFICLSPPIGSKLVDILTECRVPFVATSTLHHPDAVCYNCDNERGVRQAVSYLASLGHKKIGHISGRPKLEDSQIREKAYREEMAILGLTIDPNWVQCGDFHHDQGGEAFRLMMESSNPPTAIFAANDEMGVGAIKAAWEMGLKLPDDMSIIGFDDIPLAQYSQPSLTTVHQPVQQIGSAALSGLVELIEGSTSVETVCFPTSLVVRQSVASPRN
jgi:DNA-binding LacI/PurR family transcriptional regulator